MYLSEEAKKEIEREVNRHFKNDVEKHRSYLVWMTGFAGGIISVIVIVASYLGWNSLNDVEESYKARADIIVKTKLDEMTIDFENDKNSTLKRAEQQIQETIDTKQAEAIKRVELQIQQESERIAKQAIGRITTEEIDRKVQRELTNYLNARIDPAPEGLNTDIQILVLSLFREDFEKLVTREIEKETKERKVNLLDKTYLVKGKVVNELQNTGERTFAFLEYDFLSLENDLYFSVIAQYSKIENQGEQPYFQFYIQDLYWQITVPK